MSQGGLVLGKQDSTAWLASGVDGGLALVQRQTTACGGQVEGEGSRECTAASVWTQQVQLRWQH